MSISLYKECNLCKRECGIDRTEGNVGYCKMGSEMMISRAALHFWEEPVISGTCGSGTVFFSGCSLGCIYCQNREISRGKVGRAVSIEGLSDIMARLSNEGAHNINFVTPTHYAPSVIESVSLFRKKGYTIPIVYNTSSYDSEKTIASLSDTVDIYLADLKYFKEKSAEALSFASDYPEAAKSAIRKMVENRPAPIIEDTIMKSGVIVRILLLPGHLAEAKLSLSYLLSEYGDDIYISLMSQYTPMPDMPRPLDRRVSKREYDELCDYALKKGLKHGFYQEGGAAEESFIPPFDLTGVP